MVLDSSAIIAVLQDEPEGARFLALIEQTAVREPLLFKGDDFSQTDIKRAV